MPYIDETYYTDTYYGEAVPTGEWNRYEARAEDIIDQITFGRIQEAGMTTFPASIQTAIQKAVCAQIEYFVTFGIDLAQTGLTGESFTVGKVSVSGGGKIPVGKTSMVSPQAIAYLEQTGLMNGRVVLAGDVFRGYPNA